MTSWILDKSPNIKCSAQSIPQQLESHWAGPLYSQLVPKQKHQGPGQKVRCAWAVLCYSGVATERPRPLTCDHLRVLYHPSMPTTTGQAPFSHFRQEREVPKVGGRPSKPQGGATEWRAKDPSEYKKKIPDQHRFHLKTSEKNLNVANSSQADGHLPHTKPPGIRRPALRLKFTASQNGPCRWISGRKQE